MPTTLTTDSDTPDDLLESLTLEDILAASDAFAQQSGETDETIGLFVDEVMTRHRQESP